MRDNSRGRSGSWRILLLLGLLVVSAEVGWLRAAQRAWPHNRPASVVLLLPQQSGTPNAFAIERGVRAALARQFSGPLQFRVEYLDILDPQLTPHLDRVVDLLADKYRDTPIDVVIAHRSESLAFTLDHRSIFHDAPVVFVEIARREVERLLPRPDAVTGALVEYDLAAIVGEALRLLPDTRTVAIVGGTSFFDRRLAENFRAAIQAQPRTYDVLPLLGEPLEEQLARASSFPPDTVVMVPSYRADAAGHSRLADDVVAQLAREASVPVFGFADSWMGLGIVGGSMVQFDVLGDRAGTMAARILGGTSPAAIPYDGSPVIRRRFDARALIRLGISQSRLPAGSEILFRPPSLWADYRGIIIGGLMIVVAQGLLIGALLRERNQRRRSQGALAEAEQRYRTVADSTADLVYWTLPDGSFRYVSPSCRQVTGYEPDAFIERPTLLAELVVEEDRCRWSVHRDKALTADAPQTVEVRIRTRAGDTRWLDVAEAPVRGPQGEPLGLRGSARDITQRKRSESELRAAFDEIGRLRDRLEIDNTYLRQQVGRRDETLEGVLGTSDVMRYVVTRVRQVAPTSSTVLLLGETGVGKSQLARALHELSPRRQRPLVTLNCAALPPALVESELFGHEKGAFTGALTRRIGRFEAANGGTLFLDEIGELPPDLQSKLLRVVQDGEFERVGSNQPLKADVRLIAATNSELESLVRSGRFREDLWYRPKVFPITVPPLRQRPDDIPVLVSHFVEKHCLKLGRPRLEVTRAVMKALQARPWPGNVRELDGFIERSVIESAGPSLEIDDGDWPPPHDLLNPAPLSHRSLQEIERGHVLATLERLGWRIEGPGGAAEVLGINASTLRSRMRKLGIRRPGRLADASRN